MKTDFDKTKELEQEAAQALQFSRQVFEATGGRDFFQKSVLRSLAVIIKLLIRINEKL